MRKKLFAAMPAILMLFTSAIAFSQNKYGARELTPEALKYVQTLKKFDPSACRYFMRGDMPSSIDNTRNKFFPPIIDQIGNSCGAASNCYYIFSYEVNRMLDRSASDPNNVASYPDVWNHINQGLGYGVFSYQVYDFIRSNGAMSMADHPENRASVTEWADGFDKYVRGMKYRIQEYYTLEADKPEDFQAMKAYLADGGLMEFEANSEGMLELDYTEGSELGYTYIVPLFTSEGMHAMTIAGYDDTVWYDYDEDGVKDDFELGAFLCVNSWGPEWGDQGRFYVPYYAFTTLKQAMGDYFVDEGEGGTGNGGVKLSYIVQPSIVQPKLVVKVLMSHTSRNDLAFSVNAAGQSETVHDFMLAQGGDFALRNFGETIDVLEFGVDISDLVPAGEQKYEFHINSDLIGDTGSGELMHCTLLDYTGDSENPQEYWANLEETEISGIETVTAEFNCQVPEYEVGQNVQLKYSVFRGQRLYLTSYQKEESYARIELLHGDKSLVSVIHEGVLPMGSFSRTVDLSALEKGQYIIKFVSENKVLYKSFKN